MFVDGKSIMWEAHGRRLTADELLRAAVQIEVSHWGSNYVPHPEEEVARWLWESELPPPDQIVPDDPSLGKLVRSAIQRGDGPGCYYCGANRYMSEAMHIDHMRPRAFGGPDRAANKVRACKTCNLRKSANGVGVFRERMGERYGADALPTFFGELPKVRRVFGIETQTAKARHPNLKPAQDHPLTRMGTPAE